MRACSTGVFGFCLRQCALINDAPHNRGVNNRARRLENEHESRLLKKAEQAVNMGYLHYLSYSFC
jgi:hypothetical protein